MISVHKSDVFDSLRCPIYTFAVWFIYLFSQRSSIGVMLWGHMKFYLQYREWPLETFWSRAEHSHRIQFYDTSRLLVLTLELALCVRESRLTFITWGSDRLGTRKSLTEEREQAGGERFVVIVEGRRREWNPVAAVRIWVGILAACEFPTSPWFLFFFSPERWGSGLWRMSTITLAALLGRNWLVKFSTEY